MPEYHFPIPGSQNESQIILFVRRHWASFIGQFLVSITVLLVPVIIFIAVYYSHFDLSRGYYLHFLVLGLSIYYLIAITVAFVAFISFYYDIYIVTNDFIIDIVQEGYWGRKISQISLLRVQDVSSNIQGFFPTFFAYGDVLVETAGEQTQNFLLKSVPNPQEVATKIMQLHNELIETEGRHHQILDGEGVLLPGKIHKENTRPSEVSQTPEPQVQQNPPVTEADLPQDVSEELKNTEPMSPPNESQHESSINIPDNNDQEEGEISHNDLDKGGEIDLNNK